MELTKKYFESRVTFESNFRSALKKAQGALFLQSFQYSIRVGGTARLDLIHGWKKAIFPEIFSESLPIPYEWIVWMGSQEFMA